MVPSFALLNTDSEFIVCVMRGKKGGRNVRIFVVA